MKRFKHNKKTKRGLPKRLGVILLVILVVIVGGTIKARSVYDNDLKPVNNSQQTVIFTVKSGDSIKQIASDLQNQHLIKSSWAFDLYIHSKSSSNLEAGTYDLSSSESVQSIVKIITSGKVTTKLVTILPGRRIDQVKADLINDGFSPDSVTSALAPGQYSALPVMTFVPTGETTLEGLLWPDSFQKDADTSPNVIIQESLQEMAQHLTPTVQAAFAAQGLSVYQGLTLTSIVEEEVSKPSDQAQVAQVFYSRLKAGMPLGSDVTADYGSIVAGQTPSLTYNSPYNTLINKGLPPTPISSISTSALYAATHPASTNWLYFVAGDNGTTYFSTDLATHNQQTSEYCHKLCGE
jgi:UPF0755 protein